MSINTLTINYTDLTQTFGLYVDGSLSFNKPKKNVETISVPGRSGDLVIDYGTFQNLTITYPCFIRENFEQNFSGLMNFLGSSTGYQNIYCSNDPAHYRKGIILTEQTPTVKRINKDGYFDLSFNCMPWRYLTSGDTIIGDGSSSYTLTNPARFSAGPLIRVQGYGTITFTDGFGDTQTVTVAQHPNGSIYIDCDDMSISTTGLFNPWQYVTVGSSGYPSIYSRDTVVVTVPNTAATGFQITPRWREL